jgi:hypothetical protein
LMALVAFACAWCQRVRTGSGAWESAETADLNAPGVTHGICPECLERETRSLLVPAALQVAAPDC